MKDDILDQLRAICLALPEATEEEGGVGDPTFKVRNKIFAMRHLVDGRVTMWCKAGPGGQEILVQNDPDHFFIPPYVGRFGWIGVWLDSEVEWEMVADLIKQSYLMIAPKRLSVLLKN